MNPINPVCRPATENEINYGEAKWCAKCTSECDNKGKDELVMCDYFKTNGREATREKSSRVGNAAKMREALNETKSVIEKCLNILRYIPDGNEYDEILDEVANNLWDLQKTHVKPSLSAPPRNCDRPECATTKEAQDVWSKEDGGKTAYYEWLLATYTEGGTTDGKKH